MSVVVTASAAVEGLFHFSGRVREGTRLSFPPRNRFLSVFSHRSHHHFSEDVCCCHYSCRCLSRLKVCFSLAEYVLKIACLVFFVIACIIIE